MCQKAPKVRILPQTLGSHSSTDRIIGYEPIGPGSIPVGAVIDTLLNKDRIVGLVMMYNRNQDRGIIPLIPVLILL